MREQMGDHPSELTLEGLHPRHLGCEHHVQLVGQIHLAPVVVLRGPYVEPQRPGLKIELVALEGENRVLPPAVGKGDRYRHLKILG
jgi:hypothetical protein